MRVLQICHRFPPHPGGIEYHVKRLSRFLSSRGHEVTVLTTHRGPTEIEEDDYKVVRLRSFLEPLRNPLPLELPFYFRKIAESFDLIHMHSVYTFTTLLSYPFARRERVVITLHGRASYRGLASLLAELHERISFRILRGAAVFIALNEVDKELMVSRGIDEGKIRVIPNFIDLEEIDNLARSSNPVEREGDVQLLFVGGLTEAKNLDSLLSDLRGVDGASLWIVGDGPMRGKLMKLAEGMRVRFLGRMDMGGWIPYALSSDAIILPSRSEGFPTIVLEAMALGKPVILSDIEVHKRLFSGIAIFYRPGDRESLRKALKNLENFDIPPENLRSIVEKNYDIRVVGERILSVYSDLIGD